MRLPLEDNQGTQSRVLPHWSSCILILHSGISRHSVIQVSSKHLVLQTHAPTCTHAVGREAEGAQSLHVCVVWNIFKPEPNKPSTVSPQDGGQSLLRRTVGFGALNREQLC